MDLKKGYLQQKYFHMCEGGGTSLTVEKEKCFYDLEYVDGEITHHIIKDVRSFTVL